MRLRFTLGRVATLALSAASACGARGGLFDTGGRSEKVASNDAGLDVAPLNDAGLDDAGLEDAGLEDAPCSHLPPLPPISVALACQVLSEGPMGVCPAACGIPFYCSDYCLAEGVNWSTVNGGAVECVATGGTLGVLCDRYGGRMTEGISPPSAALNDDRGAVFAARAYLEAASVFAFARLERELLAHRAPASLARDARKAQRDEVRHTAILARLARRHGARATGPEPPPPTAARSLFAVAVENAVEGCVRETYAAVAAFVEAGLSRDPHFRRTMGSIAADECRHAELAWAVRSWARPHLSKRANRCIDRAMRGAIDEICHANPAIGRLLVTHVWNRA